MSISSRDKRFFISWLLFRLVVGASALWLCFGGSTAHAAGGTVVMQYGGGTWHVTSSSCADVIAGSSGQYYTVISCGADPVAAGTLLNFPGGDGNYVESIDATPSGGSTPPSGGASEPAYGTWQEAAAAQDAKIATLQTRFETLQTTIGSNGVDPETIQASSALFGAALAVAALVWGARRLLDQFRQPGGHE